MARLIKTKNDTVRLENTSGGHNKFWEFKRVGKDFIACWGKITADRPQGNKIYSEEEINKLVQEKIKKGYRHV